MNAPAFVAGATGLTGRQVVSQLRAQGVEAVAHVRPDSGRLDEWRGRFEAVGAQVSTASWDEAAMTAELASLRPGVIFALLGTTRARQKASANPDANGYLAVDYGLSALLMRAALAASAPGERPRFVYLSSMGVGPSAQGAYLKVRWRMEQELAASGLPFAIARPSFILGPRDVSRPGERIGGALGDALLGAVGALGARTIRDRYRSISDVDLAAALIRLGLDPSASGTYLADALR